MSSNLMWFLAADSTCLRLNRFAASGATGHQMRGATHPQTQFHSTHSVWSPQRLNTFLNPRHVYLNAFRLWQRSTPVTTCTVVALATTQCTFANTLTMWIGSIIMLWTEMVLATASIYLLTYTHMATLDILLKAVCSDVLPHQGTQQHSFFFLCSCF